MVRTFDSKSNRIELVERKKKSISYMLETSIKCLERGKQISRNRESVTIERDCEANVGTAHRKWK